MMKRITSLMAAAVVAVGLSPAWGQDEAPGEDYTSYLVNPSFTEGYSTEVGDTIASLSLCSTDYLIAPKGWDMVFTSSAAMWDQQYLYYSNYETDAPSLTGDPFRIPLLAPQDNDGCYFFHGITGAGGLTSPYTLTQTINSLPSGRYTLKFYGAYKERAAGINGVERPQIRVETLAGVSEANIDTFGINEEPMWGEGSVSFAVASDNSPVTLGLYYDASSLLEQHIYLDNFRLYRTGDVSLQDLIDEVVGASQEDQLALSNLYNIFPFENWPEGYEDAVLDLAEATSDNIATLEEAYEFQDEVKFWVARVDSMLNYRSELTTLNDSVSDLVAAGEHAVGLPALQEVQTALQAALSGTPTAYELAATVDKTLLGIRNYLISDALLGGSYENPMDITSILVNPEVNASTGIQDPYVAEGWYIEATGTGQQYIFQDQTLYEGESTGTYFNTWDGDQGDAKYTATQTIEDLPAGLYRVEALMASDGTGTYLFGRVGESNYTYTEGPSAGTAFSPVTVDVLLPEDGDLTIGVTSNGDALWGGAAFAGWYYAADNFKLSYMGADADELYTVLTERIAEFESYVAADTIAPYILKGDKSTIDASFAEVKETPQELAAISASLTQIANLFNEVDATVGAYFEVTDKVAEVEAFMDTEGEKLSAETSTAITEQIEITNVWLQDDYSLSAEAPVMIANLDSLLALADDDLLVWEKENLQVGDATHILVNPDCEDGTTGYHMESYNNAYIVAAADFFPDYHPHLCFWSDRLPADSIGFDMYQIVGNIPSGYYRMTAMALAGASGVGSQDTAFSNGNVVFYAVGDKDHEVQVPIYHAAYENGDTLTYSNTTGQYDSLLLYSNEPYQYVLDRILVNHGEFKFGMKNIGPMNVTTARIYGFTLEYLAPVEYEPYPDAIEEVGADATTLKAYAKNGYIVVETDEPYEIYSVSGGAAMNPDTQFVPGVYIVKAGSQTVKVLVD